MEEYYYWLYNRKEHKDLTGSILSSILFHALMLAVFASTAIFHTSSGDTEKLDIMWVYPSAPSGWQTAPAKEVAVAPSKEPEALPLQNRRLAEPPSEKVDLPQSASARATNNDQGMERKSLPPSTHASEAAISPIVVVPPDEVQELEKEPEMKIPASIESLPKDETVEHKAENALIKKAAAAETETKAEEPKKPPQPIKKEVVTNVVEATVPQAVKTAIRSAVEKVETAQVTANRQQPSVSAVPHKETTAIARDSQPGESKETTGSSRTATLPVAEPAKGAERKTAPAAALPTSQPSGVPAESKGEAVRKAAGPAPAAKTLPVAKADGEPGLNAAEGKGIFFPPVKGDLKLEIVAKDDLLQQIKVVALYHEYLKSRRNRPMSKDEYRRIQTLTPKLVRTGDNTRQAVIEVANEGIYEFKVETGSEQQVEASFAVKLYDYSSRARTRPVGKRLIADSESIVKVLMPEGLFWDDDPAFSGSIEDSESITKFNADSGLVWKEYK